MFKRVHIEISNICNVQCSFCPVVERPKEVMTLEQFSKVLKQAKPLTEQVCLHLMGEPLAHPEFFEILNISDKENVPIQITTNGILIKKYEDFLLKAKCLHQINFSLQAYKDNFPDRPLDGYLSPIIEFSKQAVNRRPELYINYRLWNYGSDSFKDNDEFIKPIEESFGVQVKRAVDPGGIKSKKLSPDMRLYFHFDSRFEWPSPHFPIRSEVGTCQGLRNHIGIHADGTVVPCCLDKEAVINLGNCLEEDLIEILASKRAQDIKFGFENGSLVEDLCQRCTYISRFSK